MKKPRRHATDDIVRALVAAGIEDPQRKQVLEALAAKRTGRPAVDDTGGLEMVADIVLTERLHPFTAAKMISPDLRTAKRLHRKYMNRRAEIESDYRDKFGREPSSKH